MTAERMSAGEVLERLEEALYGSEVIGDEKVSLIAAVAAMAEREAALIAENEALRELVEAGKRAIGDHSAPGDCYATGPVTGDSFRDLVECPACSFLAMAARTEPRHG